MRVMPNERRVDCPANMSVGSCHDNSNSSFSQRLALHSVTAPHLQPSVKLSSREISGSVSNTDLNMASTIMAVMPLYILIQRKT